MPSHLTGSWDDFEAWIRREIGGDFRWRKRPPDSTSTRRMIADVIRNLARQNGGVFPEECHFFRRTPHRRKRRS